MPNDIQPDIRSVISALANDLGPELIGLMCGLETPAPVKTWMVKPPNVQIESKLRIGHKVFSGIARVDGPDVARAWCLGMNPQLDDHNPLMQIGSGLGHKVLQAARTYVEGSL